jgi:hypothetical protein
MTCSMGKNCFSTSNSMARYALVAGLYGLRNKRVDV